MTGILKMIEFSTGHLSLATRDLIEMSTDDIPVFYQKGDWGWFFPILDREQWPHTLPDDLKGVLEYALKFDCDWIMFDCDADRYTALPWYEDGDTPIQDRDFSPANEAADEARLAAEGESLGAELLDDVTALSAVDFVTPANPFRSVLAGKDTLTEFAKSEGMGVLDRPTLKAAARLYETDPIAELAEIVLPNISEAIHLFDEDGKKMAEFDARADLMATLLPPIESLRPKRRGAIEELKLAAADILLEIDSEIEQRQTSGNDEYWEDLQRKSERLANAVNAL